MFLQGEKVYVPDYYLENPNFDISDGCVLFWKNDCNMGVVFQPEPKPAPSGIMIFGAGVDNWYHWLIEFLPLAHLSHDLPDKYHDLPLIVPEGVLKINQFKDSLDAVRGQRRVIPIPHRLHSFEKIIVIGKAVLEPIYLHKNRPSNPDYYAYNATQLLAFRSRILQNLGVLPRKIDKRVFLARGKTTRSYNQDELISIVKAHGFEIVYPERLSFKDQVELFHSAEFIIGASGAAFANTLFCHERTRIFSWIYSDSAGFCSFSNLAKVTGSELRHIFVEPTLTLNRKRNEYNASYTVPVDEFKNALEMMLKSDEW